MDRSDRHDKSAELWVHGTQATPAGRAPREEDAEPGPQAAPGAPDAAEPASADGDAGGADAPIGAEGATAGAADELDQVGVEEEDELEAAEWGDAPVDPAEDEGVATPAVSRKVRRRARRTRPRSKTIAMKRLTREELRVGAAVNPPVEEPRPATRAECREEARPCPWVACKHHLYLDINPETGSIKVNFPDLEPWEIGETCALDIAERGGITLEEVGEIMNLTRERIRQVEVRGLAKLKALSPSPDDLGGNIEPGER